MIKNKYDNFLDKGELDKINFSLIKNSIKRNKNLFFIVFSFCFFSSFLYVSISKKIWEADFEIVLSKKSSSSFNGLKGAFKIPNNNISEGFDIGSLLNEEGASESIATQVRILESSSILKPIYNSVKESKISLNEDISGLTYKKWFLNSLDVEREKGTSVLKVKYRDHNRERAIEVVRKISKAYQDFSKQKKVKNIENSINYVQNQLEIFKDRSLNSLRAAQEFAIKQDLTPLTGDDIDKEIPNIFNLETIRVQNANQIRKIDAQIEQLKKFNEKNGDILYFGSLSNEAEIDEKFQELLKLDQEIALVSAQYVAGDVSLLFLENKRKVLNDLLANQLMSYLKAKKLVAEATLESTTRPKGVLIEYKNLARNAKRDIQTLQELEIQKQLLNLQKAKDEDPWELVSQPFIDKWPVAPRRARILALGLFSGIFLGGSISLIQDKKNGILSKEDDISSILSLPIIMRLNSKDINNWDQDICLLISGSKMGDFQKDSLSLIKLGKFSEEFSTKIKNEFLKNIKNGSFSITKNLMDNTNNEKQILIIESGKITVKELELTRQRISFQKNETIGIILIS